MDGWWTEGDTGGGRGGGGGGVGGGGACFSIWLHFMDEAGEPGGWEGG